MLQVHRTVEEEKRELEKYLKDNEKKCIEDSTPQRLTQYSIPNKPTRIDQLKNRNET